MLCFISPSVNRIVISVGAEDGKCRIYECDKIGVSDKLGLCLTHYDQYEEVKQEIIQDDYYL